MTPREPQVRSKNEAAECTTPKWCAENGCQHSMSLVESLRAESRSGEDGYRLVPLDDAIRAVNAALAWERRRTVERIRERTQNLAFYNDGLRAILTESEQSDE